MLPMTGPLRNHRHEPVPVTERTTETPLVVPSLGRTLHIMGRALRLRCPHCGKGKVLDGWAHVRERCSACGFRFERSSDHYFAGAMLTNIIIAELIFVAALVVTLRVTWPEVPWDLLQYGGAAAMIILPIALYPFSKVTWLAADVLIRPATSDELAGPGPR